MLHFENGRIKQDGISCALPNEFYFNPYDDELVSEKGIRLIGKTQDYYLQYSILEDCESTEVELGELIHSDSGTVISDIEAIECNGLHGHQAFYLYGGDEEQYFEMRLSLPDDLQFALMIATTGDILKLVQSEEIQSLLREIRAE